MKRNRKAKIVATLGPASSSPDMIDALFRAGVDVFRINMSHATHEGMRALVGMIRGVEAKYRRPIGILVDLQGPKLRLGSFAEGAVELKAGQSFVLDDDPSPGDQHRVYLPHPEILEALRPGHAILLDDGKVRLEVLEASPHRAETRVVAGRRLSDRKGVSLPNTVLRVSALTEKDRRDLEAALHEEIDWVALSFIQRPEDIAEARKIARGKVGIMAKIEKPQALERIDEIIEISDSIMVARGDLGVEMPIERVPGAQKRITRASRRAGKPVIVATQMLESMITAPVPTRAEVSDVAAAVFEGADAVMLSAESAAGEYPVQAVETMNRIAEEVERDQHYPQIIHSQRTEPESTGADTITAAARQMAETLNVAAIVCFTSSGSTGLRAARERPGVPIIALSPIREMARRLALVWGLHCVVSEDVGNVDEMVDRASQIAFQEEFATPGQRIIITAGVPFGTPGATNLLRLAFVGSDGLTGI
ncbi:pyruvate kinase [Propylenella binzhouense]|uniref:Pyruvate kinase n=1 Tax=Propylenella binzhouense TaxID=2555902 RepID=A0A964T5P8_9HYPH|nr:pyruvate kinase [Propylenella binzhouense]MYZ48299.1 pyruvate kinase [Propylenella binzhouense]